MEKIDFAYKKIYYCHSCKKDLSKNEISQHKDLGHQVIEYETMPGQASDEP